MKANCKKLSSLSYVVKTHEQDLIWGSHRWTCSPKAFAIRFHSSVVSARWLLVFIYYSRLGWESDYDKWRACSYEGPKYGRIPVEDRKWMLVAEVMSWLMRLFLKHENFKTRCKTLTSWICSRFAGNKAGVRNSLLVFKQELPVSQDKWIFKMIRLTWWIRYLCMSYAHWIQHWMFHAYVISLSLRRKNTGKREHAFRC